MNTRFVFEMPYSTTNCFVEVSLSLFEMVFLKMIIRLILLLIGIIGCVDGSHIPIDKPTHYQTDFYNRHQQHSILLQGTCNELRAFTDVYIGYPGRASDSRVFRNSSLLLSNQTEIREFFSESEYHILGDCAYPLKSYILKPFIDNGQLTPNQRKFNSKLSACRCEIEIAFGRLKGIGYCYIIKI